ncbi:Uncharacterized protein APZ42_026974 [Daphnia magna]|uniref:Uncharacterized protein n=2 Tax=Daphnia magna TaxID=35525 RepID=A0ABQ9YZ97_9CRUS|nr:hypothetical protein OUZ56_011105 [Daphnia magna]KZS08981.1 Uncharacterized protein APZ42_026974 [Daphnia magna]
MRFTHVTIFLFFVFSMCVLIAAEDESIIRSTIDKITDDWGNGRTSRDGCIWKGTSPFCDGGCNVVGHVVRETSSSGDGERCLTGIKVLCCPSKA